MAAPDRDEVHRGPCLCGGGEFVVDECSPDNPWSGHTVWLATQISCPRCAATYSLQERGRDIVVVRRSDIASAQVIAERAGALGQALMDGPLVQNILAELEKRVASQQSVAAQYRLLNRAGLAVGSETTFRKRWSDASSWIGRHASHYNLRGIMELLGRKDVIVESELAAIEELRKKAAILPAAVGPTVFHWTRG